MFLADSTSRLLLIMEVQYGCMQLGNEFINVIQAEFASLNFTWLSAKGQVTKLRHCKPHNSRLFLHRKISLVLCE